jgi:hypothetical protein
MTNAAILERSESRSRTEKKTGTINKRMMVMKFATE